MEVKEIQKERQRKKDKLRAFLNAPIESRVIGNGTSEGIFETLVVEKYENEA